MIRAFACFTSSQETTQKLQENLLPFRLLIVLSFLLENNFSWAPLGLEKEFPNSEILSIAIDVGPPLGLQHMIGLPSFPSLFHFLSLFMLFCSPILSNWNFRLSKELERNLENSKQLGWAHHGSFFLGFMPESLINYFLAEILLFQLLFTFSLRITKIMKKQIK